MRRIVNEERLLALGVAFDEVHGPLERLFLDGRIGLEIEGCDLASPNTFPGLHQSIQLLSSEELRRLLVVPEILVALRVPCPRCGVVQPKGSGETPHLSSHAKQPRRRLLCLHRGAEGKN
jgi:hypothetical protein